MKLYIRNMACESCKVVVKEALTKLKLHPLKVELGEVEVKEQMGEEQKEKLNNIIQKVGLELVENKGGILIEKIKKCAWDYVRSHKAPTLNFSDHLAKQLKYDYTYLSNIFSEIEATTINGYLTALKVEYAKELIMFDDLTLSEVAERLHYSNLAHFSTQFKKATGFPPSHFKTLKEKRRLAVHELAQKGQ